MNKNIIWHEIFNNKNFFYTKNSKKLKKSNYSYYSFNLLKIIYPELTYVKFRSIIKFMENILGVKKKNSMLDFGSGNGAFLNYFIAKYNLKNNFSFEISLPLINFQKKIINRTNFYQTHHSNLKVFEKINNQTIVDYSISNSVFQYFYSNSYCFKVLDFLIRSTKNKIFIYDIKDSNKRRAYKEQVRLRQNLSRTQFNNKYKNTPIRYYTKKFFIRILKKLKKKYNFNYEFISLPLSATDSKFGYCLLIKKYLSNYEK
jgi:cyclopropane fatty-acyl-phospholipid synthase-like methyltransferase